MVLEVQATAALRWRSGPSLLRYRRWRRARGWAATAELEVQAAAALEPDSRQSLCSRPQPTRSRARARCGVGLLLLGTQDRSLEEDAEWEREGHRWENKKAGTLS